ncbi:hypothetical protein VP1G_09613 [Cytospora mali]|uniref:Uncharacterized protein n=1 Tax=Cytospora mali TaxID=578113 RepID=A0A194VEQ3_CYTMA|nr:hypothetical protein VP1G_09613 [Valsa mali var. pyri (nom. inval.)]
MIQLVWRSDPTATTEASSTMPPVLPGYISVPPPPGLSTGAKAGIGVAACSVVLSAIGSAVWFLLRHRHRRRMRDRLGPQAAPTREALPFELSDPRSNRYELESPGSLNALASPKTPSELPRESLNIDNHDDRSRAGELVELE